MTETAAVDTTTTPEAESIPAESIIAAPILRTNTEELIREQVVGTLGEQFLPALASDDVDTVEDAALHAGLLLNRLKRLAATLEAERPLLRARLQAEIREEGRATSDKAAENLAKQEPAYVAHCAAHDDAAANRDVLEILSRVLDRKAERMPEPSQVEFVVGPMQVHDFGSRFEAAAQRGPVAGEGASYPARAAEAERIIRPAPHSEGPLLDGSGR